MGICITCERDAAECQCGKAAQARIVGLRKGTDICRGRHGGNHQSEKANDRIEPHKENLRERIYRHIAALDAHGATTEEVSEDLGLRYTTVSARLSELKNDGRLVIRGERMTKTGSPADVLVPSAERSLF